MPSPPKEAPDDFHRRVGRCPPGFRWEDSTCAPTVKRSPKTTQKRPEEGSNNSNRTPVYDEKDFKRPPDNYKDLATYSEELDSTYRPMLDALPEKESRAIEKYTGLFGYQPINNVLRARTGTMPDSADEIETAKVRIEHMDKAFKKLKMHANTIVYRGAKDPKLADAPEGSLVGTTFKDPGYMSTTIDHGTAYGFLRGAHEAGKKAVMLEILLPKGAPAAYVDSHSENEGELEVLVNRGAEFTVRSDKTVERNGKPYRIVQVEYNMERKTEK